MKIFEVLAVPTPEPHIIRVNFNCGVEIEDMSHPIAQGDAYDFIDALTNSVRRHVKEPSAKVEVVPEEFDADAQYFTFTVGIDFQDNPGGSTLKLQNVKKWVLLPKGQSPGSIDMESNPEVSIDMVPRRKIITRDVFFLPNGNRSLSGIHNVVQCENLLLYRAKQISGVLDVLKINGLKAIHVMDNTRLQEILNKHLFNGRNLLAAQEELIDAGLEEYAE